MHIIDSKFHMSQGGGVGYEYGITNIEYTEFKRLGIADEAQSEGSALSVFPANTNVLYLSLKVTAPPSPPPSPTPQAATAPEAAWLRALPLRLHAGWEWNESNLQSISQFHSVVPPFDMIHANAALI